MEELDRATRANSSRAARDVHAPLLAQLLYWCGNIQRDLALGGECEATLLAASVQALEARDDASLAQTWTRFGLRGVIC